MKNLLDWNYCFLFLNILIILFQGAADGFLKREKQIFKRVKNIELSKLLECFYIVFFISFVEFKEYGFWFSLGFYLLLRIAIYDIPCNLIMSLKVNHAGNTSLLYDSTVAKLKSWQWWVIRVWCLGCAILMYVL